MYICVDFDGTIVDHAYPDIGNPVPGAIEWLKRFNKMGAKLILFTMRSDDQVHGRVLSDAVNYLKRHGVKLYGINTNPSQASWTSSPKAYGQLYIDNSAVGCPLIKPADFIRPCVDWESVGRQVEEKLAMLSNSSSE